MRPLMLLAAVVSMMGCAATRSTSNGGSYCNINEAPWASAPSAFDRRLTLEVINSLRQAVDADVRALHEGRRAEIGDRLSQVSQQPATTAFISSGVSELAGRLRQLDCAVRANRVPFDAAAQRYTAILGELSVEQATLEPKGGAAMRGAAQQ